MIFAHPVWFLLLPFVVAAVAVSERRADGSTARRWARGLLRGLVLALLVAALAQPETSEVRPVDLRLVVARDASQAMSPRARVEADDLAREVRATAEQRGAAFALLDFEEEAAKAVPAAGLAAAGLAFEPGEGGGVLLLTTGRGRLEGLRAAAEALRERGIAVQARALPTAVPPEPGRPEIESLDLPDRARGPFDVRLRVAAAGPLSVALHVDGAEVEARPLAGSGSRALAFTGLALTPGWHEIAVVAETTLVRRLVHVDRQPRLLAVLGDPHGSLAARAAAAQGFAVDTVDPAALGGILGAESAPPEVVLLDAAAAAGLPPAWQEALLSRIENGMGLFVEAGSDEEAWGRLADGPLARALPLGPEPPPPPPPAVEPPPPAESQPSIEPPKPDPAPGLRAEREPSEALPISLMLVLDRSGSMMGRKLAMAIEAARRAASTLSRFDRVAVITFAEESTLDVPPSDVGRLGNIGWRLAMLEADGNTDIYGALARAAAVLGRESAPIRHVILLTDGRQNAAEALFGPLARRMARAGITLTAVGLGHQHDEVLLKRLVQFAPRGRYVPADTEAELPTILTRDTQRVAEEREREARALARIPDPEREPSEAPTEPPEPPVEPPEPPEANPPSPPPEQPEEAPALARLYLLRPHEATRGLEPDALPEVGPPRLASPLPLAALLLVRGDDDEIVLAARRVGLGRVLAFALPPDAAGLASWDGLGRVFVQGLRSVRAPEGVFDRHPTGRVLKTPEGERLRVDGVAPHSVAPDGVAPDGVAEDDARPVTVLWSGPEGERDLGTVLPGQEIALPALPAGRAASVRLRAEGEQQAGPSLTYLAASPDADSPRAGDAAALERELGAAAMDPDSPLLPRAPPPGRPAPRPLWPYLLMLALVLLPVDVGLHRRTEIRA